MTLEDFIIKCWSMPKAMQPTTIYVFEDRDNAESWMRDKYYGENNNDSEILFVWHTFFTPSYIIKEEWCKKEVDHFIATEQDVLVVCLEEDEEKDKSVIHCNCTDEEIAKSFIEDVEAVKDLLPMAESEDKE